jgi:nucleoside-diphosphate-sugar epimerase
MRLAVTGASGFVGSELCRAAAAAGWTVYGYGRRPVRMPGVCYRIWDLDTGPLPDPSTVDVVVHAAAAVTDWGPAAPVWRTNLGGTRHVLTSFPHARVVYVSTASVYDPYTPTVHAREDAAPVSRYLTAYAASKAAAELLLAGRPNTLVVRPHAVYGPGDPTLLPRVLAAVRGDALWIVGDGRTRHSLTSIDNLVSALLLACDRNAPPGVYNVADAEPVVLGEALGDLVSERGLPVKVRGLPVRPALSAARIAEAAWRITRRPRPPRLTRYAISQLAVERTLDLSRARTRLGFRPAPTSFAGAADW